MPDPLLGGRKRPVHPYWHVPKGARKAHWFGVQGGFSGCRYYAYHERGRMEEPHDKRCRTCEKELG